MTIETSEPQVEETTAAPDRPSVTVTLPSRRALIRGTVVVVLLALIAAVTVEAVRISDLSNTKSALSTQLLQADAGGGTTAAADRASALNAATAYTVAFATYSYQHLAQDFAVTESHAVEPFLSQYRKETAGIRADLVKLKSISTGRVLSAGVASITSTSAVVDLFLDQTIVNSASAKPRVESQRVQMTLSRSGAGSPWQISKVALP